MNIMFFSLSAEELEVLKLSCQVAAFSLLVNLIPALFVGWLLARKEFWGKSLFETLVFLPLVLPPVVPGYLLLEVFGNNGILGQYLNAWGLSLAFNWKGAVLAAAVMGFPLFVQSIRLAIELVDQRLEMAAKTVDGDFITIQNKYMMEEVEVEFTPIADKDLMKAATGCEAMNVGSLELIREKLTIKNKEDGNNN